MPQKVTLTNDKTTAEVLVKKTTLKDSLTILEGFDPSACPPEMEDGIQFFSKDLTAIIPKDSPVRVHSVKPTDEYRALAQK